MSEKIVSAYVNEKNKVFAEQYGKQAEADHGYPEFERLIAARVAQAKGPLFTTDASGLWEAYLAGIPGETRLTAVPTGDDPVAVYVHSGLRQHYNCNCCRRFIERYGGLVNIDLAGGIHPFLFDGFRDDNWPAFFGQASMNITQRVIGTVPGLAPKGGPAKVTGVFVNSEDTWGVVANADAKRNVVWTHLCGKPNEVKAFSPYLRRGTLQEAEQRMAELRQDYILLKRTLAEVPLEAAVQAVRVLEADQLDRSEKTLGAAKWFYDVQYRQMSQHHRTTKDNLVWLAVATAPPGFAHIRTGMLGTLFDDILAGLDFAVIKRRWDAKMHPLQYQRPTKQVSEGNVKQANELVAKLGAEGSLARRFARLEDVLPFALWRSLLHRTMKVKDGDEILKDESLLADVRRMFDDKEAEAYRKGGPFDHLVKSKAAVKPVELPPRTISWPRFRDEMLPTALKLELLVPQGRVSFFGLVTAVNPEAPPILQWDGLRQDNGSVCQLVPLPRNPVSWYFYGNHYASGSLAPQWGLSAGGWVAVNAVAALPCHWQQPDKFKHVAQAALFMLAGCVDQNTEPHGGFFPECLKAEFHGIRAAMEAYAGKMVLEGREQGNANGLALAHGNPIGWEVRATKADGGVEQFRVHWRKED